MGLFTCFPLQHLGGFLSTPQDLSLIQGVIDNDTRELELSETALTVTEGGSATYTVALATEPTGQVTVTVGGTASTDLSVDESTLTFTTSDWSTTQTVEVTAGADPDGTDDIVSLTHTASGADYGAVTKDLLVTVTDTDTSAVSEVYVLFPGGYRPLGRVTYFGQGDPNDSYEVRLAEGSGPIARADQWLLDTTFFAGNKGIRLSPRANVSPAEFVAAYGQLITVHGSAGVRLQASAWNQTKRVYQGDVITVEVRYDASAIFDDTSFLGSQRWGTPRVEVYEGATSDPAMRFSWSAVHGGIRLWRLSHHTEAIQLECRVGGSEVSLHSPAAADRDHAAFSLAPLTTNAASGEVRLAFTGAPDYETLAAADGGYSGHRVRIANVHTLTINYAEGASTGCSGSLLEVIVVVKDAGAPTAVRSLAADHSDGTSQVDVTWTIPAGFVDPSDNSVVPFDAMRMSFDSVDHSPRPAKTAVSQYEYRYRSLGTTAWTTGTTSNTEFSITGLTAAAISRGHLIGVRAVNAEGAGPWTNLRTGGLILSDTALTVAEGESATYTVALAERPTGDVTVAIGGTRGTELSVGESTLTFTRSDWSTAQTVEVTAGHDPDTANDSETLTHTAAGADYDSVTADLAVTVTDDDMIGLEFSEASVTVAEGGSATYTVALGAQPSGQVTVTVGGTANTDLSVDESSLTFSASDWSTAQTVEVTAGEDPDGTDDIATLTHTATGADYGSVSKDLAVTVTDNDTVGLELSETTLTVAEGGRATYTVALVTQPSGQVTVTVGGMSGTDLSVDESSLTFSASDWSTAQTVEVTAGEDPDGTDDIATLTHTATGADYGSVSKGLDVTVTDNDTVGLDLSETTLTVAEGGRATYTVALVTQPSGQVTVTVGGMSGTDLSVDESSLTFSASDWSTAQTVEVTAGEDPDGTDDIATLTHTATGADYGSVSKDLAVTVTDDDTVGLELSETTLTVAEGGRATYTVALVTEPSGQVTVTVGGTANTDLSVDESSLTFSASDWSTAQTVEVTAGEDPDTANDSETLTHTATGADYGSVSKDLAVTVTDNDTVGLDLSEGALTVAEGGSATYTVALVTQPSGQVTVTVGGMSGTDLSVDESSLTFSASDWSTAQTVEVTAGEDPDGTDDIATLTHTATGADYGSVSKGLDVTVTDNDTVGLELSETTLTVAEGGRATYTVALVTQPSGQVTVTVGGMSGTDLSVDESSLTFSASDWSTAQTVEVTAGEDPDTANDSATLTHTATGADYGSVSKGLDVTVTDNDTVGLELSETTLTVAEGGSATYTVALVTEPSGQVTVTVGGTANTDLSVDESSLTFSASDWSTAQTVEVTAGEDPDTANDSETLTHTATGADYGSVSKGLDVTVTDNDTVGLDLSETTLTVAEGGRATYTVALVTQPSGQVTVTVGGMSGTDLSVDESSLTFSASDWSTAQTVEVTAGEDPDGTDDSRDADAHGDGR